MLSTVPDFIMLASRSKKPCPFKVKHSYRSVNSSWHVDHVIAYGVRYSACYYISWIVYILQMLLKCRVNTVYTEHTSVRRLKNTRTHTNNNAVFQLLQHVWYYCFGRLYFKSFCVCLGSFVVKQKKNNAENTHANDVNRDSVTRSCDKSTLSFP